MPRHPWKPAADHPLRHQSLGKTLKVHHAMLNPIGEARPAPPVRVCPCGASYWSPELRMGVCSACHTRALVARKVVP